MDSPATTVGRYVLVERIGEGGMGSVYRAYDPRLRREIAIKLIRVDRSSAAAFVAARVRLLREAQSMAQLAHPNVLPVFDVGQAGGQLFIAMELADGSDLRKWLAARPRSPAEILAVFADAARGLQAAHGAGVVHRDFKPGNVLISAGDHGRPRVRVSDFGLARLADSDDGSSTGVGAASAAQLAPITEQGTVVGTPPFLAPELHYGEPADVRSDEFAFGVALWESLFGTRPWLSTDIDELLAAKLLGPPRPPSGTAVPPWATRLLARLLAPDPAQRFGSMQHVVEVFERELGRRARRGWLAAAGVATVALALGGAQLRTDDDACGGARAELASAYGDDDREAIDHVLTDVRAVWADDARSRVLAGLDAWTEGWQAAWVGACTAARAEQGAPAELVDLRIACLRRARGQLAAAVDVLAVADDEAARNAVDVVAALPSLAHCADTEALLRTVAPPDPAIAEQVDAARQELARAAALHAVGRYEDGLAIGQRVLAEAEQIGYAPLVAHALAVVSSTSWRAGDDALARESMERAYFVAGGAGDSERAAQAAIRLVALFATAGEGEPARVWGEHARMQLSRIGEPAELESERLANLAIVDSIELRNSDGLAKIERATELAQQVLAADDTELVSLENQRALFLDDLGRGEEALAHAEHALATRRAAVGDHHPDVANLLINVGVYHLHAGELVRARSELEESLAIMRENLRAEHPAVALVISNLAAVAAESGELERADALAREALAIRERTLGPDHVDVAASHQVLGDIARDRGQPQQAALQYAAALAILERAYGAADVRLEPLLAALGTARRGLGELAADR